MSISIFGESSKRVLQDLDTDESVVKQDSLLADAFDSQIKLVGKLLAESKGNAASLQKRRNNSNNLNKSVDSNTKEQDVKKQQTKKPSHKQLEYSHRSRIYRYETDEGDGALPPKSTPINKNSMIHPPTDFRPELFNDMDSQTDARAKMLMSWYMAGYHTGYYDAMSKYERDLE